MNKSARYGIKIFVLTDAETSYVLDAHPYFGIHKAMDDHAEYPATQRAVLDLCKPYFGTHRLVYTDRYYTSVPLAKELLQRNIHLTGTIDARRIPYKPAIFTKKEGKEKGRGALRSSTHRFVPATAPVRTCELENDIFLFRRFENGGETISIGLVSWMDKKPVNMLSTCHDNTTMSVCKRRVGGHVLDVPIPTVIEHYNANMGGVDLADKKRLSRPLGIKGLHRWWLKLFFYAVDVAILNAHVLHLLATGKSARTYTSKQFKIDLMESFLPDLFTSDQDEESAPVHIPVGIDEYAGCAVCCLRRAEARREGEEEVERHRTKTKCSACNVPVCRPSSANQHSARDCFAVLHASVHERERIVSQYRTRQFCRRRQSDPQ